MTNTRISLAEAYDNKDVIQQILLMKDTVRNGTYADLNVERGTGADIGKIVFDFTLTSGEHQIFKVDDKAIASTSAAQAGTTVTVTVTYNDGTSDTFTFSTLIGAMTLDTAQTATAKKTFSAGIATAGVDDTVGIDTTGDLDVGGDAAVTGGLTVGGDAEVDGQMQIGSNLAIEDSSSDSVLSSAGAIKLTAEHVEAGSRAYASAGSSDVLVKSHVAVMPVVHLTGNESIAGVKTLTSADALKMNSTSTYNFFDMLAKGANIGIRLFDTSADKNGATAERRVFEMTRGWTDNARFDTRIIGLRPANSLVDSTGIDQGIRLSFSMDVQTGTYTVSLIAKDIDTGTDISKTLAQFNGHTWS